MKKIRYVGALLVITFIQSSLLLKAPIVYAKEALETKNSPSKVTQKKSADYKSDDIDEIIVTGSRLVRTDYSEIVPLEVIDADAIKASGLLSTADVIQQSLAATGPQNVGLADPVIDIRFGPSGGVGSRTVSLQGLGEQRTLILLNGRRLGASGIGATTNAVDLSSIPLSRIERIEILKDGASSIYGADAIGGVINIITKKKFDDLNITTSIKYPFAGGGRETGFSVAWGSNLLGWQLQSSLDLQERKEILESQRSFSRCPRLLSTVDSDGDGFTDSQNPSTGEELCFDTRYGFVRPFIAGFPSNRLRFDPSLGVNADQSNPNYDALINGVLGIPFLTSVPIGSLANQGAFYKDEAGSGTRQIKPETNLATISLDGAKELSLNRVDGEAYFELFYNRRETKRLIDRRRITLDVDLDSPLNPFRSFTSQLDRGFVRFQVPTFNAPNEANVTLDRFNGLFGLRGALKNDWQYDVNLSSHYSKGTNKRTVIYNEYLAAISDVIIDENGELACAPNADFPDCVPFNPLNEEILFNGNLPADVLAFLYQPEVGITRSTINQVSATLQGKINTVLNFTPRFLLGAEVRRESLRHRLDTNERSSFFINEGGRTPPTRGAERVTEIFSELEIPFDFEKAWTKNMTLNLTARYTDFEFSGSQSTHRIAFRWQLSPQINILLSSGSSYRSADVFERNIGNLVSFATNQEPCRFFELPRFASQTFTENCETLGYFDASSPLRDRSNLTRIINGSFGDVDAEEGRSRNFSLKWKSDNGNLSLSANYAKSQVDNAIFPLSSSNIGGLCTGSINFSSPFCQYVTRDSSNRVTSIQGGYTNAGTAISDGITLAASYETVFQGKRLWADFSAIHVTTQRTFTAFAENDPQGRWGYPDWRGRFAFGLDSENWSIGWDTQYIGPTDESTEFISGEPITGLVTATDDYFLHRFTLTMQNLFDWETTIAINNVFDKQPPQVSRINSHPNAFIRSFNTIPGVGYDLEGRAISVQLSKSF